MTVTDANLCQTTQSFTITQPSALTATTSQTDVLCNGGSTGSASVTVTGGTGAYTYSWAPSGGTAATATGLVAGIYTVTITDANGCFITRTFTITQAAPITVSQQPIALSVVQGTNATFSVTATNATAYQWQVSTNGTTWTDVANGGTSPVYSGATTSTLTLTNVPLIFNTYLFRVKVSNGVTCFINSNTALLTVTPNLNTVDFKNMNASIYPNPTSSIVSIKIPEIGMHDHCKVVIYDLNGRLVMERPISNEVEKIDISNLEAGMYIFNISSDISKTTKRVVKY